jgi:hypothetical protein
MTLDEQIAWLEDQACEHLEAAKYTEAHLLFSVAQENRDDAAVLLTIENRLRALRDEAR